MTLTPLIKSPPHKLEELRRLIGAEGELLTRERNSFSLYPPGFALGSVTEIAGSGKSDLVSQFLGEHKELKAAWVESEISINPYALFQKGVRLENVLFIEAKNEVNWCITQALQSGCFKVLIACGEEFNEKELRRYQLLSEKAGAHFFLLSEHLHQSWVPHLQLEISKTSLGLEIEVFKKRGFG